MIISGPRQRPNRAVKSKQREAPYRFLVRTSRVKSLSRLSSLMRPCSPKERSGSSGVCERTAQPLRQRARAGTTPVTQSLHHQQEGVIEHFTNGCGERNLSFGQASRPHLLGRHRDGYGRGARHGRLRTRANCGRGHAVGAGGLRTRAADAGGLKTRADCVRGRTADAGGLRMRAGCGRGRAADAG